MSFDNSGTTIMQHIAGQHRFRWAAAATSVVAGLWLYAAPDVPDTPAEVVASKTYVVPQVDVPTLTPLDVHPRTSLTVVEQLRYNICF